MKNLGIGLLAVGVVVAIGSLFMSTSVSTETPVSIYGRTTASEVYNLGLLQHQMMIFVAGLAIAISGVTLAAAGVTVEAMGTREVLEGPATSGGNISDVAEAPETPAIARQLTPEELAERDRDLNRATFMVAGGLVVFVGIIFIIVMAAS